MKPFYNLEDTIASNIYTNLILLIAQLLQD